MKKTFKSRISISIAFAAGVFATLVFDRIVIPKFHEAKAERLESDVHAGQLDLINPLISCGSVPTGQSPKEAALEDRVRNVIGEIQKKNSAIEFSVYYRDLNNGPAMSVDADRQFIGASLIKVPVAIMYLRKADRDMSIMDRKLTFHPGYAMPPHVQTVAPPSPLVVGQEYSIEHLIQRMLILSDNTSAAVLIEESKEIDVIQTLKEMGVPLTVVANSDA